MNTDSPSKPSRLAYLLAASHSGSTLFAMLLNSHPQVGTVGELKITSLGDVTAYRCSCRRLIRECPFWLGVTEDMRRLGHEFDVARPGTDFRGGQGPYVQKLLRPLHRGPVLEAVRDLALNLSPEWRAHLPRTQAINAALIASVLARSRKDVIVDSSKIAIRLKYLLRNPALDVRVVRLVRDGRAVALTYVDPESFADARDPSLRGGGSGASRAAERLSMAAAAAEWKRSNEEAEAALAGLERSQWIEVRYEQMCADPDATLARVFEFLGVDPEAPRPTFRDAEHHVIGNGMRLDSTSEVRLDDRWRTALSAENLEVFDRVAGETNRRLGYR
jgi:hypothetical protein